MKNDAFYTSLLCCVLLACLFFNSCDPGLRGDLKVFNHTSIGLTVATIDRNSDTMFFDVEPFNNKTIFVLGGLGSNKHFECCPCRFEWIYIYTNNGFVKKNPQDMDNWEIPNKKKLRKFCGQDVRCEFHITTSDL